MKKNVHEEKGNRPPPSGMEDGLLAELLLSAGFPHPDARELEECRALWEEWSAHLTCATVEAGGGSFLAVWLGEAVDRAVDAAWAASPSRGFLLNALAQALCMDAVRARIPEVAGAGCAPVPEPAPELAAALTAAGLPARAKTGLAFSLRYVVVTRFPFGGTCGICALRADCPRADGYPLTHPCVRA